MQGFGLAALFTVLAVEPFGDMVQMAKHLVVLPPADEAPKVVVHAARTAALLEELAITHDQINQAVAEGDGRSAGIRLDGKDRPGGVAENGLPSYNAGVMDTSSAINIPLVENELRFLALIRTPELLYLALLVTVLEVVYLALRVKIGAEVRLAKPGATLDSHAGSCSGAIVRPSGSGSEPHNRKYSKDRAGVTIRCFRACLGGYGDYK